MTYWTAFFVVLGAIAVSAAYFVGAYIAAATIVDRFRRPRLGASLFLFAIAVYASLIVAGGATSQ